MAKNSGHQIHRRTWFVASLLLLLATAAAGAVLYPGMADPVPVHWDVTGEADAFASKSVLAVFSPLMIGAGVVAVLWLLHRFLPAHSVQYGNQDPALAAANAETGRRILAAVTPAMAVLVSWLSLQVWLGLTGPAVFWIPLLAIVAYTTVVCIRAISAVAASERPR